MSLLTIKENTIGQFICAMIGKHTISDMEEDKLYKSDSGEIDTFCDRCGIRLTAKIDAKHEDLYTLSRVK